LPEGKPFNYRQKAKSRDVSGTYDPEFATIAP